MTVKTVDATDLRNRLGDAIEAVSGGEMLIVKKRGKDSVAMIDLDSYEDFLAAQDPKYLKDIAEARAQSKRGEVFAFEDVFGDI